MKDVIKQQLSCVNLRELTKFGTICAVVFGFGTVTADAHTVGSAAITLPWNTYLESFTNEISITVKYLAILGIIISAIGLFLGNAGDGMKKMLIIMLALSIAAYAATIVEEIM